MSLASYQDDDSLIKWGRVLFCFLEEICQGNHLCLQFSVLEDTHITINSISLIYTWLYGLFISSWVNLDGLEMFCFIQIIEFMGIDLIVIFPYYPFNFCRINHISSGFSTYLLVIECRESDATWLKEALQFLPLLECRLSQYSQSGYISLGFICYFVVSPSHMERPLISPLVKSPNTARLWGIPPMFHT